MKKRIRIKQARKSALSKVMTVEEQAIELSAKLFNVLNSNGYTTIKPESGINCHSIALWLHPEDYMDSNSKYTRLKIEAFGSKEIKGTIKLEENK